MQREGFEAAKRSNLAIVMRIHLVERLLPAPSYLLWGDKHTYARRTCLRRHKLTYLLDWN